MTGIHDGNVTSHDDARVTGEAEPREVEQMQACLDAACEKFNVRPLWWAKDALLEAMRTYAAQVRASMMEEAATRNLQSRVQPWMMACFGPEISADKVERNDRFLEEALELTQASGYTAERAHALVDYTFNRPQGEINQEVGGVMITLAAHCLAHGVDMHEAGERELTRIWGKINQIRAKQAAKPRHSPLPVADSLSPPPQTEAGHEADGWIPWQGGECPVAEDAIVEVKIGTGIHRSKERLQAWDFNWAPGTTITHYRPAPTSAAPLDEAAQRRPRALNDIAAERTRQIKVECWTVEHDDQHTKGELADAAACYAAGERALVTSQSLRRHMSIWPWDIKWWKPTNRRRDLIKAAALIVAEIERLDRAAIERGRA